MIAHWLSLISLAYLRRSFYCIMCSLYFFSPIGTTSEFLSNFYPAKIYFEGIAYLNSEAAYQAQKCADAGDRAQFSRLSADEAKRLGQKTPLRSDWDQIKLELMERIVHAKFSQHPRLAKKLLETGDKPLFEGNYWHDVFWGIDMKTREGENHLGRILMALRGAYRQNGLPDESEKRPVRSFGPIQGITVTDEDITELELDCIVNATDNRLAADNGVSGAIHREAGPELLKACQTIGWCETGQAVLTEGYELSAKYVIRAVGPVYQKDDESILARCYRSCMELARQAGIHSIAHRSPRVNSAFKRPRPWISPCGLCWHGSGRTRTVPWIFFFAV